MNKLMRQAFDPEYTMGRADRVRVDRQNERIAYKAPNGMFFIIHTSTLREYGEPLVWCREAVKYGPSHKTHTMGDGWVCLALSLRKWDLTRILFQCDSWARGLELYQSTGVFPSNPGKAFRQR